MIDISKIQTSRSTYNNYDIYFYVGGSQFTKLVSPTVSQSQ